MIYSALSPNPKPPFHVLLGVTADTLDITFAQDAAASSADPQILSHQGRKLAVELCNHFQVHLEELRSAQDWKDACLWGIGIDPFVRILPYNILADSHAARRPLSKNVVFVPTLTTIKIVVPFAEAAFTDMDFFVERPDPASLVIAEGVEELPFPEFMARRQRRLPVVRMEGPSTVPADAYAAFTARVFQDDVPIEVPVDVELESVNGYLPKTRVRVWGTGDFKVGALGLAAGDTIKVKAGFRYLAATSEVLLKVV